MSPEHATAFLESTARASGLDITPDALQAAAAQLASSVERDGAGTFTYSDAGAAAAFKIEGGQIREILVQDHVVAVLLRHATPAAPSADTTEAAPPIMRASPNGTSYVDRIGPKAVAAADKALLAEAIDWPNPFAPEHFNRTRQTILRNRLPQVAAKYQAEARK